jgi:hypothetical protein
MSQQVPFSGHFNLFPRKLLSKKITLLLCFPAKFTLSLYFYANDRKPNERLKFFNRDVMKKISKGEY